MSYLKNKMGGGKTLAPYTSPEVSVIELRIHNIVCQSLVDTLAADSSFESMNEETTLVW